MLLILFLQALWEGVVYHSKENYPRPKSIINGPAFFYHFFIFLFNGILDGKVGFLRF